MPPASLQNGDYRMVASVQSNSDPNAFYGVLLDHHTPKHPSGAWKLSCDCPAWVRDQRGLHPERACKHTDPFAAALSGGGLPRAEFQRPKLDLARVLQRNPLLDHLQGRWELREVTAPLLGMRSGVEQAEPYYWVILLVTLPDGVMASGTLGVPLRAADDAQRLEELAATWCGWMIADTLARRGGMRPGQPPRRYRMDRAPRSRPDARPGATPLRPAAGPVGLGDVFAAAERTDLGDGLTPKQRAENLLRMFLNADYQTLTRQHYLDVPSRNPQGVLAKLRSYGHRDLPQEGSVVFRVRLDPQRQSDKRVRLFVDGTYRKDLCIVRGGHRTDIPVQDAWLSIFLGLMSNELHILQVVGQQNVFRIHSDGMDAAGPPPRIGVAA